MAKEPKYDLRRAVARSQGIAKAAKAVLVALADHSDHRTGRTFVGQDTLAAEAGVSRRTVIRAMAELEALGWITRERRHTRKGYRTSDYVTVRDPARVAEHQAAMLRLPLMVSISGGKTCAEQAGLSDMVAPGPKCHGVTVRKQIGIEDLRTQIPAAKAVGVGDGPAQEGGGPPPDEDAAAAERRRVAAMMRELGGELASGVRRRAG